jgi:uncharacterized protein (TIGR04551 family)
VRADMFRRLDFENRSHIEQAGPRYPEAAGSANFVGTNMRLRLEPRINVTDKIQIVTTLDVLDNLVLGSTPNTIPTSGKSPVNILATGQNPPSNLTNALTDSIVVKRAYARVTALNEQLELRIGRMPNHWGLGMFANSGDCLDCDYGDITDRVALSFRAAGHLFTPMFDWAASGPLATPFGRGAGQALDALDRDDVDQFGIQVERLDHPEDIRERVGRGEQVINYGAWGLFRTQSGGVQSSFYEDEELTDASTSLDQLQQNTYDPSAELTSGDTESRDGFIMAFDAYGKLFVGDFELAAEAALIWGHFKDTLIDPEGKLLKTSVYQLGAAFEGTWYFPGQRPSRLTLKLGGASGDSMRGWGALDAADTQRGRVNGRTDNELENFQFSPDYHVDLLMFRRIIGTVTDAWYVRPGVTYMFDENFAGSLAVIYSQAIFRRTTPGGELPMGIEFDAEISYGLQNTTNPSPFAVSIVGGIAVPLGAFNVLVPDQDPIGGDFAWTVQGRFYITF